MSYCYCYPKLIKNPPYPPLNPRGVPKLPNNDLFYGV